MVKIIYFITDLGIGGAEKVLLSMLSKLDKEKYTPIVCCLYGGELRQEFTSLGIKVVNLDAKNKLDFSVVLKFFYLLIKEKPVILHTHLFHANIIGRIVGRLAGVPTIISTQHYSSAFHGYLGVVVDKISSIFVDKIIAVCEAAKSFCVKTEKISPKKVEVIYNGIDLDLIDKQRFGQSLKERIPLLREGPIIGCVGRFVEVKGYRYLLYAVAEIIKCYPTAKFMFLGYGPLKDKLKDLTLELNIQNKVMFFDSAATRVTEFLSILDVYVLPSLSEGLSITLLEAMAMNKPIVATNVGGNSEVIIDYETGILVPAADSGRLSQAIITVLQDNNLALRIAANARKRVEEKFSINTMLRDIEQIYDSFSNMRS